MPLDYKPPTRLATLLRSGRLYWSGFAIIVFGIVVVLLFTV